MKLFNINEYIYIKITKAGEKLINESEDSEYYNWILANSIVIINEENWYRIQCWRVFEMFPVSLGCEYFATTILFDDKDLIEVA